MSIPKVVVLTGGPCGGKSSFLPIAKQWLEDHGYSVGILAEAATEVITGGFSPVSPLWPDNLAFQHNLLEYQLVREDRYFLMLSKLTTFNSVLLCDRGALDSMAYMGRERYLDMLAEAHIDLGELRNRYTSIIHLMSAARGAADFYTLANNAARSETPEQAAELDLRIEQAWLGHPHFTMIDNQTNFTDKVKRALSALARVLHVPEPLEIERKYLVHGWKVPIKNYVSVEIIQDYLVATEEEPERRVRKRVLDGTASYFYTSKIQTLRPGVRVENERQIDLGHYEKLLKECDPNSRTIRKDRLCFLYAGKHFELDVFRDIQGPDGNVLKLLEVELTDIDEKVELPSDWTVEDVTGRKEYSNAFLARRGT
jgi:CYTH domain-containing protein/predicted ATPase